jgi:multisubunit Na+/H+ antiporter MnhB subunit
VLVVFRGFDTFGEVAVVFAAALAVVSVRSRGVS